MVEDDPDHAFFVLEVLQRREGFEVVHVTDPAGRCAGPASHGTSC